MASSSSSSSAAATSPADTRDMVGNLKDAGREGRLSFKKFKEHQLRNEFRDDILKNCQLQVKALAECSKAEGLMVVFRCKEFHNEVNECMAHFGSNDRWEQFKQENSS